MEKAFWPNRQELLRFDCGFPVGSQPMQELKHGHDRTGQLPRSCRRLSKQRRRALDCLLQTDQGLSDRRIAEGLAINQYTVARVRKRFCEEGLERAPNERPRPGQKRKLSGRREAHLVAIACSDPPEGNTHWTLKLLAGEYLP